MKLLPALLLVSTSVFAAEPMVVKLWPSGAPEKPGVKIEAEKEVPKKNAEDVQRITNVTDPMITSAPVVVTASWRMSTKAHRSVNSSISTA
jgi:hypothetical protein